ncbi:MAG: flagellar biosynthesis protein FlhF [Sulfuritalea sp.]|nr:flagellar biosynthesis protein FlhF [Sulfuritalea sp.]
MTVKRFIGATARDCLRRVKAELGPDAVVISNKPLGSGVEIVAMTPEGLDAISRQAAGPRAETPRAATATALPSGTSSAPKPKSPEDDYTVTLSSSGARKAPASRPWNPYETPGAAEATREAGSRSGPLPPRPAADTGVASGKQANPAGNSGRGEGFAAGRGTSAATLPREAAASPRSGGEPARQPAAESLPEAAELRDEMRIIKGLLERQLAGFAWGDMARNAPVRAFLLGEMIEAGFSGQLARRLAQDMPEDMNQEDGRKWLQAAVNRRLRTLPAEADFIDRGGVYAIVGPTGVGKTTTTAKLAARCVVRYGADRLALLTTDGYRIGAQEQLRIYGRILGVPVFVVRDGEDLRRTLADLRDKHMVLIDTVGMSQRDRMVAEQAAMLMRSGEVNRLLLLNAGCRGDTLDDVVRAYSGEDLAGCIVTKVDEATALAPALDCIVRHGLTLSYVANGQRVPEDLHLPNRAYLLHRAFKVGAGETAHSLHGDEVALAMAPRSSPARGASYA